MAGFPAVIVKITSIKVLFGYEKYTLGSSVEISLGWNNSGVTVSSGSCQEFPTIPVKSERGIVRRYVHRSPLSTHPNSPVRVTFIARVRSALP